MPSLHGPGVLVVVDEVIHCDLFVPPMNASMACAAARCIHIEGHTPFIPPSTTYRFEFEDSYFVGFTLGR